MIWGPPDPLQLELAHGFDLYGLLDLRQHSRTDQDLTRLGFIAEARGHVRYRPDGGIIEAPLITNRAERSEAVRKYLVGDAQFELLVKFHHFVRSFTQFLQQSRVFDGYGLV